MTALTLGSIFFVTGQAVLVVCGSFAEQRRIRAALHAFFVYLILNIATALLWFGGPTP